jgi:putative addiction module component (TIGR02574 family)
MASRSSEDVLAAALTLPAEERERLAHELLDSLDDEEWLSPDDWEAAWDAEIERRLREIREHTAELVDGEEVFRDARARIAARRK